MTFPPVIRKQIFRLDGNDRRCMDEYNELQGVWQII